MAVEFEKLKFTRDWNNSSDFPTYEENEQKVRADMQALHDETKEFINETLIPSIENLAVPGTGDMKAEVYDPEGKRTNVYAYTDQKIVETTEALQSHVDNRNNPHSVTAEQVMVTENVVNAIKGTGNWSVDGVLAQLGSVLLGGETLYRWMKTKKEIIYTSTTSRQLISYSSGTGGRNTWYYSKEISVNDDGTIELLNYQSVYNELAGNIDYNALTALLADGYYLAYDSTAGSVYSKSLPLFHGTSAYVQLVKYTSPYTMININIYNFDLVTATAQSELVTSTDPNAYTDGYIDEDGFTYTELDPITAFVPRIQTGSYVGTGTYGYANPCRLTFSFVPKALIIVGDVANHMRTSSALGVWVNSSTHMPILFPWINGSSASTSEGSYAGIVYTANSTTVQWYASLSSAYGQLNTSGVKFYWFAIG